MDLKIVHEKEQLQQRLTNQDAISGIQNRQALDEHVGSLIHAPGNVSQQPPSRSMNISNISARVISHSGHVIAGPRRETEIIPQAQSAANRAARIPAVVAPEMVIANGQRGMNQAVDDPFMAAILRIAEAGDRTHQSAAQPETSSTHSNILAASMKVQQETRHIELQGLMQRHKFAQELSDDFPNKAAILAGLTEKIFGHIGDDSPICREDFGSSALNTARLPCCTGHIHTSCLSKLLKYGSKPCPLCRKPLE